MVKVDDYYRNPPTPPWAASIKDRVWYVRDYWRQLPNVSSRRSFAERARIRERRRARR